MTARVICGMSGGVDSAVVAALINKAIGNQMTAIFVDNGVLRGGEAEEIRKTFTGVYPLNLDIVDAKDLFLEELKGVTDPEEKRKIIGRTFIEVFYDEADRIGGPTSSPRGRCTPMSLKADPPRAVPRPPSRATTTWAACRRTSSSRS